MEYNKFFSPQTLEKLNKQSAENLKTMLGDKTLMQTMISSQKLLDQIAKAEAPYKTQLEKLAVDLVKEIYPIIDREGINIEASLGDIKSVTSTLKEDISISGVSPEARRRITNAITQGAAIRGAFAFYLFKEHLDDLDPQLVEAYNQILKNSFGIYDDNNAIAMMLSLLAQGHKAAGGSSQVVISEAQSSTITIKANAINFPMLVHEIVKGLFELISLQGFKGDKQQNQAVANKVDKLEHEPEDLQKGKFIYDALRNIGNASGAKNKTMPYFFTEVYKLDDEEFMDFVERAILDRLTDKQKRWAQNAIREIEDDMYEDDIDAIDEIKLANPNLPQNRIISAPVLYLKIGKYDISKGRHGFEVPFEKVQAATKTRVSRIFNKLGIKPEKTYFAWIIRDGEINSLKSTFVLSHYKNEPILIAQT